MLSRGQIKMLRGGVNAALGLTINHRFGYDFVDAYIVGPCESAPVLPATYDAMVLWVKERDYKYVTSYGNIKKFRLNPARHDVLLGILMCLSAVLRVDLIVDESLLVNQLGGQHDG